MCKVLYALRDLDYDVADFSHDDIDYWKYDLVIGELPVHNIQFDTVRQLVIKPEHPKEKYEIIDVDTNSFTLGYDFLAKYISTSINNGYYLLNNTSGKFEKIGSYDEQIEVNGLEANTTYYVS